MKTDSLSPAIIVIRANSGARYYIPVSDYRFFESLLALLVDAFGLFRVLRLLRMRTFHEACIKADVMNIRYLDRHM